MLNDIAQKLADSGVGTLSTDIFTTYLPNTPDTAVAVIDTGGPAPPEIAGIRTPTFQVVIRSTSYTIGKAKLDLVRAALQATKNTMFGNTFFNYILLISEGGHTGRDDVGRDLFSLNFRCRIR